MHTSRSNALTHEKISIRFCFIGGVGENFSIRHTYIYICCWSTHSPNKQNNNNTNNKLHTHMPYLWWWIGWVQRIDRETTEKSARITQLQFSCTLVFEMHSFPKVNTHFYSIWQTESERKRERERLTKKKTIRCNTYWTFRFSITKTSLRLPCCVHWAVSIRLCCCSLLLFLFILLLYVFFMYIHFVIIIATTIWECDEFFFSCSGTLLSSRRYHWLCESGSI